MKEYIEREALLSSREKAIWVYENANILNAKTIREALKPLLDGILDVPAADVAQVRHGEWIPVDEQYDAFDCSECDAMVSRMMNYCPRCGARMTGESENA